MISGATRVFAVVGQPIAHSLSPALHNRWLAQAGIDGVYVALPVPAAGGPGIVPALRTLGLAGINVTAPFKEDVAATVDARVGAADALGAVNTVVRAPDGRLVGHNTDAAGFVEGVHAAFGPVLAGARVAVIGAGGAGVAVAAGAASAGAHSVAVHNRSVARAEDALTRVAQLEHPARLRASDLEGFDPAEADVVVVSTSGPATSAVAALPWGRLRPDAVLVDLRYGAGDLPWLAAHRARGGRVQDGLPMLAHQAARAFFLFTGISPDASHALRAIG